MGSLAASLPSSLPPFPRPRRVVENNRFPRAFAFGGERPHKFSFPLLPSLSVTYTSKQQTCACTYFLSLCSRLRVPPLLLLCFFPWREQNSRRIVILAAHELFWRTGLVTASLRSAETHTASCVNNVLSHKKARLKSENLIEDEERSITFLGLSSRFCSCMHVGLPAGSDRSSMQPRFQFVSKLLLAALLTAVCLVVLRQSSTGGGSSKADDAVRIRALPPPKHSCTCITVTTTLGL